MKSVLALVLAAAASVSAHSWIECVHHENAEIRQWMQGNSTLNPPVLVDPTMPNFAYLCKAWPRHKANPGNWIDESTNLAWNLVAKAFEGDTSACHPSQRSPGQLENAPIAQVAPGGMFRLRYGGNGHARGHGTGDNGDPGTVSLYWKKTPEVEVTDQSEFTDANRLASAGFSDNSFAYPADTSVTAPPDLIDKGNWWEVTIPAGTAPGRYPFVWVWSYQGKNQWSSCFDVQVTAGASKRDHPRQFQ